MHNTGRVEMNTLMAVLRMAQGKGHLFCPGIAEKYIAGKVRFICKINLFLNTAFERGCYDWASWSRYNMYPFDLLHFEFIGCDIFLVVF